MWTIRFWVAYFGDRCRLSQFGHDFEYIGRSRIFFSLSRTTFQSVNDFCYFFLPLLFDRYPLNGSHQWRQIQALLLVYWRTKKSRFYLDNKYLRSLYSILSSFLRWMARYYALTLVSCSLRSYPMGKTLSSWHYNIVFHIPSCSLQSDDGWPREVARD